MAHYYKIPFLILALGFAVPQAHAWRSCDLSPLWNTSDELSASIFVDSQAHGVASTLDAVFAVGYTIRQGSSASQWTVRESFDQGGHWQTVDEGVPPSSTFFDSGANGVATDHGNGHIYVVGRAESSSGNHWVVRRSRDDGFSWRTVDDFSVTGESWIANGVAVDREGAIFVVGHSIESLGGGNVKVSWVTRRSEDGGATWSTVDNFTSAKNDAQGLGVAVSRDGKIFAVGFIRDLTAQHWVVRASSDGGSTWSTVDSFNLVSNGDASAYAVATGPNGEIAVVGTAVSLSQDHWIVRAANEASPTMWTTIDNFVSGSEFFNFAQGVAFTLDGQIFTTGATSNGSTAGAYLTRQAQSIQSPFDASDSVSSQYSPDGWGGYATTADALGNVYTVGNTVDAHGRLHWLVRELGCESSITQSSSRIPSPHPSLGMPAPQDGLLALEQSP